MGWTRGALFGLTLAFGCTISDLDLEGRPCPCADGWTCDAMTMTCVEASPLDGGLDVTSADAARADAGSRDVGTSDGAIPDSAIPDSAIVDGAPGDAGPDAPAPTDPCLALAGNPRVLGCESFEGDTLEQEVLGGGVNGSIELDTSNVHSGAQSIRIDAPTRNEGTYIEFTDTDLTMEGQLWVRAWYFVEPTELSVELMEVRNSAGSEVSIYTGRNPDGSVYSDLHTHSFPTNLNQPTSIEFPLGRWACIEVRVDYAADDTIRMFFDSEPASALNLPLTEAFNQLFIGVPYRDPDLGDLTLYVDDIVVSLDRIGCE